MTDQAAWPRFGGLKASTESNVGFFLEDTAFKCLAQPPAIVWKEIAQSDWPQAQVIDFLESCIADQNDILIFQAMIESRDIIIPIETLRDIVVALIQEYSLRPTTPSIASSNGQTNIGTGSMDGASSTESI